MPNFSVTFFYEDDLGEPKFQFDTLQEAHDCFKEMEELGRFARLIRWVNGQPDELRRVNYGGPIIPVHVNADGYFGPFA